MSKIVLFLKDNIIDITLILILIYPVIKGFLFKFSSKSLKNDIEEATSYTSFIIGTILGVVITKGIFIRHDQGIYSKIYNIIPENLINMLENKPILVYLLIMPIIIFIVYKGIETIIGFINRVTFYLLLDVVENFLREKSNFTKRIIGLIFQTPKAICYVILATFLLNILSVIGISSRFNNKLESSQVYSFLSSELVNPITNSNFAKNIPNIINNSFKIVIKNNADESSKDNGKTIVYYNGITLEEGLKSNDEIDNFARKLVADSNNTRSKAKVIYNWVGKNIDYDYAKVDKIMNNDFTIKSGAIPTFYSKKGICFDYSCLYAVMCRANGIKTRIITGEGYNGSSWVSHAWNQVYIEEENKWINVDTTFYKGGNYFDSSVFKLDHRNSTIAN
ncbi:transglutaminase-like superfamily protein [Clostridium homopropionicum DSM 5847]|uniref:Transglutaminase-like superfamily protein n=1 Tax=Clostridium homopropionicum DSM 5847 TaxID=1121318 RepID=A0A0L6ZBN7_9CLOT|nr:transglutaminase-like domain-containing protein [Clostridium homopropionicum]KOA20188.1 transglutaminase-like superfamily protein [Clostridium homopropionicum DSM 5847]SFG59869.1 Transglutaminase-like superfamily protein [Clostridium homopropionicum]